MPSDSIRIAILDDYQHAALHMADWSSVAERASIVVFADHVADADALVARLEPFDVVCVMRERTPMPRAILERLPRLRLLTSTGSANASIDMAAAEELGIRVTPTGYTSHGAIELTWALILAAVRNVPTETRAVRAGGWQIGIGGDLHGRTLGIAGLGRIGSACARIARAFEMDAIAWSPNFTAERAAAAGARFVDKTTLLRESDVLTVQLVLSDRTRGIFGADDFAHMKRTAWFVNTSRGPLADEAALVEALRAGRIAGAALDAYAVEPLPLDHPFRSLPNVIATPHVGFVTEQTYRTFFGDMVGHVNAWLDERTATVATR